MKAQEQYYKEVIDNAITLWKNENHNTNAFKDMEKDPIVNLLLKALAYQSYRIEKNVENYEENTLRILRDRIIPHHFIQPIPAYSIVQSKIKRDKNNNTDEISEITVDENFNFEFKKNKNKYNFVPLLTTKIIEAELDCSYGGDTTDTIYCTLQSTQEIKDLSGISIYFDTDEPIEIIRVVECSRRTEIPIIKPNQYNELPFTAWFNNNHWFLTENFHLFGTYDYWQEIFLSNITNLYYIDNYNSNKIYFDNPQNIELEIMLKTPVNTENLQVKINCIPVVQVEKNEITLEKNYPIKELVGIQNSDSEFLNLLCDTNENDIEAYTNKFIVRQFGVERYNPKRLLEQLCEIERRYISDYYAFQDIGINDFTIDKKDNVVKTLQDVIREVIKKISDKLKEDDKIEKSNHYYAVLRKETEERVYFNYLTTSGELANGIKKEEKTKNPSSLLDTKLLIDTQGGRNAIIDEAQKEDIAKYYFQTKDKLVTIADIRAFCYKELESKNVEKINIEKSDNSLIINIILKENHKIEDKRLKIQMLQRKLSLRTNNYNIQIELK